MDAGTRRILREQARDLSDMRRRVRTLETAPRLAHSAFQSGSIDEYDADGNLVGRTGQQHDGTHTSASIYGPVPPAPTIPAVTAAPGGLTVSWDGHVLDGEGAVRPLPMDFQAVQVLAVAGSDPTSSSPVAGVITSEAGGDKALLVEAGVWHVSLRTRSLSGRTSQLTPPVVVEVVAQVDPDVVWEVEAAKELAEFAQAAATEAAGAADTARETAEAAQAAAASAAGVAAGKGDVLIQSAAPAVVMRKATTLWIDTTGGANTPKRWNGASWVAVTDKAATEAAAAAAAAATAAGSAQNAADDAQQRADDAHDVATAAGLAAAGAQTTANGKNRVTYSTAVPTAAQGTAPGDLWFRLTGTTVIAMYEFTGGAWLSRTLANAVIATLDAAKITTGLLNADRIAAGSITAVKINIDDLTATAAFIQRVRALGITLTNAEGEVMLNLTGESDQVITIPGADGTPVVSIDNTGRIGAKSVTASDSMLYRGRELADYWARTPEGLVAIGGMGQIAGTNLWIAAGREMGLFDVPVPRILDRWYKVTVSFSTYPVGGSAGAELELILRAAPISQNVVVTPAASPSLGSRKYGTVSPSTWDSKTVVLWFRDTQLASNIAVGENFRLLLSVYVSNQNVRVDQNTTMTVEAVGPRLPFTQTINQGGATTPPPGSSTAPPAPTPPPSSSEITYTREWYATQHRSYITDGGGYDGGAQGQQYAMQGYSSYTPGKGRQASLIFFNSPDIRAALSGSTIEACSIYVKNSSFFAASGGVARIMNHNQDGPGGTSIASMSHVMDVAMGRGEGRWIEMPVAFAEMLRNGSSRGFGFAALGSSSGTYYGQFEAQPSRIAIRYRK